MGVDPFVRDKEDHEVTKGSGPGLRWANLLDGI